MFKPMMLQGLSVTAVCLALAACSSVEPTAYSGLASSHALQTNVHDKSGRIPYSFSTQTNWHNYSKFIIAPVEVYRGQDNQFGDLSEQDRQALADYAQAQFTDKLGEQFTLASEAGPGTLRVKVTLTGATTTTPVIAPLSRFDIAGGIYNVVQTTRGREGAFTGSVSYAVEIYDASNNRLLDAYVTKQYPSPYNLGASFGALHAAKTGIDKGADALLARLRS